MSACWLISPSSLIFALSGRSTSSSAERPSSTQPSDSGDSGGVDIGSCTIHSFCPIIRRWTSAQDRSRSRHVSPSRTTSSIPRALAFHISWSSSSLLATWR